MYEEDKKIDYDYGKDVDSLVRIKDDAYITLFKSKMKILEMGVKTEKDGILTSLPGLDVNKYLKWNNQEFSWEAEYDNGKVICQFEGTKENHYGNIDKDHLKIFRWVSCFDWATDNKDKRVIVSLNFKNGKFEFLNGFCPQEVRAKVSGGYLSDEFNPKLIMKIIKRTIFSQEYPEGKISERMYYNRYLIGWEGKDRNGKKEKRILCIEPNGFIHLWEDIK